MDQNKDNLLLTLMVKDASALKVVYMDYIDNGGVFVATSAVRELDSTVTLLLKVPEYPPTRVDGKVIWITPKGAQGGRPAGLGIQFTSAHSALKNHINQLLAEFDQTPTRISFTM